MAREKTPIDDTASDLANDLDVEEPLISDSSDDEHSEVTDALKTGVKFRTAAAMSIVAAIAGGAFGWIGPKVFDPANAAPADAIRRNAATVGTVNDKLRQQGESLTALQAELSTLSRDVSALSLLRSQVSRLEAGEEARAAVDIAADRMAAIAPLSERLDLIEALLSDDQAPEADPSVLLLRLKDIEDELSGLRLSALTAQNPVIMTYSETPELLQKDDDDVNPSIEQTSYDVIANFPRQEMLTALNAQAANAENPSWLRRMLSKHISVRDTRGQDSLAIINKAEALTREGNISEAITTIETLNPTLRAAARPWMLEAKKTL